MKERMAPMNWCLRRTEVNVNGLTEYKMATDQPLRAGTL